MTFRPLTENYIAAVTVPANVASISSPSKAIPRLLAKRESEHNAVVSSMKQQFQKHSLEIEDEIRKESSRVLEDLERIKTEAANASKILETDGDELFNLDPAVFQKVSKTVQELNERRLRIVDEHNENLTKLERERSKRFKGVLNEAYEKMGKICHLQPYDLLQFVESEIVKLNEITMSNYQYYSKIQSDLKQQIQEDSRIFNLELAAAKERHKTFVKCAKVKGVVANYKSGAFMATEMRSSQLRDLFFVTDLPRTVDDVAMWSKQIQTTLDDLDANARKLVNLYKSAVIYVFNRFFEELKNITNALTEEDPTSSLLNIGSMSNDMYKDIVVDISTLYRCDIADLQDMWNSITTYMESNIKNTYSFLNGTAHLWDDHFERVREFGHLIMQDLKLVIDKHDKAAVNFDLKMHTTLDKLREGSTVPKLNGYLRDAKKILDSIGKLYSSQCDAEIKVLQKYQTLMNEAIDLLISEIDRFLTENEKNENIQARRSSAQELKDEFNEELPLDDPNEKFIPQGMKACQYQVDAVNNWMFGLWDAIRHYMETCRGELTSQADVWVETNTEKLKKRLEVRLATHKPRYPRVMTGIYDVRLKELEDHFDDLKRVEERIGRYFADSYGCTRISEQKRFLVIKDYEKFLRTIEDRLQLATKSHQVGACIEQTKHEADVIIQKMEETFVDNLQLIEKNRSKIDRVICNFSSSIKLFVEGGNYSRDEAKSFKNKIQKVKKSVPKRHKKLLAEYNGIKKETLTNFAKSQAAIIARLSHSKAEFDHKEEVCKKVKDLQNKIRRWAYDVKFKLHRTDACIDYYSEISKCDIWKRKHFDVMKDAVVECLEKIKEMTDLLTDDGTRPGSGYLNGLNDLIRNSFDDIKAITEKFYTSHGAVINKGKIQGDADTFMDEVQKNFDGFRVQVEIHCLDCVQELITHVLKLLRVNDDVFHYLKETLGTVMDGEDDEESSELSRELSEESLALEERKKFLQGEAVDPVQEVVLTNSRRVKVLHDTIRKLWENIENKLALLQEVVTDEREDESEESVL